MTEMSYELQALGWAALIWVLHFLVTSMAASGQVGMGYLLGPRDEQKELTGAAARLKRAMANYNEGLLLFAVAVVLVVLGQASSELTQYCAGVFLASRLLYIPAYALGWSPWRTLIWFIGFAATLVMVLAALF